MQDKEQIISAYKAEYLNPQVNKLEDDIHSIIYDFENKNKCGILLCMPYFIEGEEPKRFKLKVSQSEENAYELAIKSMRSGSYV